MIKSKALEINIASYTVDVDIDPKYACIQEALSRYYGLMEGLTVFLKELSHPYKNWEFIVSEARGYALNYFHLLKAHPKGADAAGMMARIFFDAIEADVNDEVRADAVDNLLLYLQRIITESKDTFPEFLPILCICFKKIAGYPENRFFPFVKSYYQIKKAAQLLQECGGDRISDYEDINLLLIKYLKATYQYWLKEKDPFSWFVEEVEDVVDLKKVQPFFKKISHKTLKSSNTLLAELEDKGDISAEATFNKLIALPDYGMIAEAYRDIPQKLNKMDTKSKKGDRWKVIFQFHIMNISGLSLIHEECLRDINRTISRLIENETYSYIGRLIRKTFSILEKRASAYPITALTCVRTMGKGVYKTDEIDLVNLFIDSVVSLGFQTPNLKGVGNDWQIQVNTAHIQNIRTWLEVIEFAPKWSTRLLSNLIINIAVSGVFIKDTDLFPQDITGLLNSGVEPVYSLVKQLSRLLPVFFNDIGAEGELRDISTELDELTNRRDVLIHFLRKQSHVESSNRIVLFMEAAINFWTNGEKHHLEPYVPPDIFSQIKESGPYIDGVKQIFSHLQSKGLLIPDGFLTESAEHLDAMMSDIKAEHPLDVQRVLLLAAFYKLLIEKYNLDSRQLRRYLDHFGNDALLDIEKLKSALDEKNLKRRIFLLMDYLEMLKSIILSDETFEARADIYKKRHFTIDIPSMYGSYHEKKFDAMGLTFRIESFLNVLFEELIENIDLNLITKATFLEIYDRLMLFDKALKLDGISSIELERQLDLLAHSLEVKGFTFTQYLDIFKGFAQAVKNIINDYFNNIHGQNLTRILSTIPMDRILDKYFPKNDKVEGEKLRHRISEIFFRDRIATSLGLQQLDVFLSRILNTLFNQSNKLPTDKLHLLLNYDPKRAMTAFDRANNSATGIIYLGSKGLNMMKLKNFGFPVPPGFIITTESFRCRALIDNFSPAEENFREQVERHIKGLEKITDRRFGDSKNPLLLSVRSGSSISQPGMMDTFLDVGINEEIAEGIANSSGNRWFAWDNYRRFLQCYGMAYGLDRNVFDAIISSFKEKRGIPFKRELTGSQMKNLALAYKKRIQEEVKVLEDPMEQLHMTIKAVFSSWESSRARTYRKIMGISDDWGTAVTVQKMVFGNLSMKSGTGVIFTHNPRWSADTLSLWGDFTLGNQGEDVVAGLVRTLPITVAQQDIEMRETDITLESHFPEIYKEIKKWVTTLVYQKSWSPQEMEFTFEGPTMDDLFFLQTRDMSIRERKTVLAFDFGEELSNCLLGNGIGVSGGAMCGRAVFSLEEMDEYREHNPEDHMILVRGDTVPDDIKEIFATDGILTARGGVTSHASVVAHRLGKTCVVGCGGLECSEKDKTGKFGDTIIRSGDYISIDGREGTVYQGKLNINET